MLGNGDNRQSLADVPAAEVAADVLPVQPTAFRRRRPSWRSGSTAGCGRASTLLRARSDGSRSTSCAKTPTAAASCSSATAKPAARLPSGVENVVAIYRTRRRCARADQARRHAVGTTERPPGFDKVTLAGIVSGGADPEDGGKAREAAPGKVQSLGRLVSIRDYETEILSVPGVVTATAAWDLHAGVPA